MLMVAGITAYMTVSHSVWSIPVPSNASELHGRSGGRWFHGHARYYLA